MRPLRGRPWAPSAMLSLLLSCDVTPPGPGVAELAPGVPPFSELRGVHFGMRSRALLEERPRAVHAPYTGWREAVGSDTVYYAVDRPSYNESVPPSGRTRLVAVTAYRTFGSDSLALADWSSRVAALWPGDTGPSRCYQLRVDVPGGRGATVFGRIAAGSRERVELSAWYVPAEHGLHALGPYHRRSRVRVSAATPAGEVVTEGPMVSPEPCPAR